MRIGILDWLHLYLSIDEPQRYAVQMQREMMREIETARPKYLVFVAVATSW